MERATLTEIWVEERMEVCTKRVWDDVPNDIHFRIKISYSRKDLEGNDPYICSPFVSYSANGSSVSIAAVTYGTVRSLSAFA